MIEMEVGTVERWRVIEYGLTGDKMVSMFAVSPPLVQNIDPSDALNRKRLHQQELDKLRKSR